MSNPYSQIPEEIAPEVFALASRLYAEKTRSYSLSELMQAGAEVQIPPEYIQQAVQQIQAQRKQTQERPKRLALIAVGVGGAIIVIVTSVGAAIALYGISAYNSLVKTSQKADAAWAQVENQFQRRTDLIPNLVTVAQAYARQERDLLGLLTQSRQSYLQAGTQAEKIAAMTRMSQAIGSFQVYVAQNPQMPKTEAFNSLLYELSGTENRIAVERMRYNDAVQNYNQTIQIFPNSMLSQTFGFRPKLFYKAEKADAPVINPDSLK